MKTAIRGVLAAGLLVFSSAVSPAAGGGETTFFLYNAAIGVNHWPGPDGLIGTADDVVSSSLSNINSSSPNTLGMLSYNAFDFSGTGANPESALLPNPMNAVTFLTGTVTAWNSGTYPITNWSVQGTEPYVGHGPFAAQITGVNSGWWEYSAGPGWVGGPFSENLNFTASLVSGTTGANNFTFAGTAFFVSDVAGVTGTGNAYVDSVLLPLGRSLGASQLFFAHGTGTVPASTGGTGGYFPAMPLEGVLVGFEFTVIPEPSTMQLLCLGLLGAGLIWRRRR